jgi:hypothetical protein
MQERRVVVVGIGRYIDGKDWDLTGEVFWEPQAGAKVSHLRSFSWFE